MNWHAHVTVATVIEQAGRFLLVEETKAGRKVLNQPAGHLEPDEALVDAAVRETLEETGWHVRIDGIVGIGLYKAPSNGVTYYRTTFHATPLAHDPAYELDADIDRALWLSLDEIRAESSRLRSPMVLEAIEQYLTGHRYPLSMIMK
ncbi:NUDIX hydrolase [Pseudomonas matsuisoli]|uniref:Phosphatase NudJ n=1 Tax=Pseudomonas matsuisoli TaxID=1515666 RepID=A0A917UTI1_9PSED|nr:NUDIX hydrolase [Pseudomonas matsuisoli]GGJ84358.1 NUDIX hydrolase [Pseudomonas matsuisoli]